MNSFLNGLQGMVLAASAAAVTVVSLATAAAAGDEQ